MKTVALAFLVMVLLPSSLLSQPIEISTPEQLQAINKDAASRAGHYILVNDIDLAGFEWLSIGVDPISKTSVGFAGILDGNGHVVRNLTVNNDLHRAGGLIGKLLAGGVVKNVGVVDCNITSKDYAAAVVGDSFGEVYNCFCAGGSVSSVGTGNFGTFCGMSRPGSSITNCYSIGVNLIELVASTRPATGGFIGTAAGGTTNCYYVGGVITPAPDHPVGAFAGQVTATGTATSCYFNLDEGGIDNFVSQGTTAKPGGRITDDMMQEATYVGWDFANVWAIDEGQSYPQLRIFLPPNPKANGPLPKDGGVVEDTFVELSWTAGAGAATHKVYIGEDRNAVAQGTVEAVETAMASLVVGIPDAPLAPSLTPGTTYYWRVDAVGDKTTIGDVWSFSVAPETAYGPSPADAARMKNPPTVLSWKAGFGAILHYVTIGTSLDEVKAAELGSGIETAETTVDPGLIEAGRIIYWRVDELNGDTGEFVQGPVWSFATASSVVDDFEGYKEDPNDPGAVSIFDAWLDGWDETLGNGTGAVVSNEDAPYAEQFVVHSGTQAMPFNFDNTGQTAVGAREFYSETSRAFAPAADWSGQTTLALWYRGRSQNAAEILSVVITDAGNNSVVIENAAEGNAVQASRWMEWAISLGGIEGIDLSRVATLAIRIGDPATQKAGSKGKIYIDDIAIYPQTAVSSISILVPNGNFEQIYKPGSQTITADLGAGWTQGIGPDTPMDEGTATFSDGTTGNRVDIPEWVGADAQGWIAKGGTYGRDTTTGNRQGSVGRQTSTPDGLYYFLSNGGDWGNPAGGLIVSKAPLAKVEGGLTYTLSMLVAGVDGGATPVVLELLADGVPLTPSSSVNPVLSDQWQGFSRTYSAASLAGQVGKSLTIRLGIGRGASGAQTLFDAVRLSYVP